MREPMQHRSPCSRGSPGDRDTKRRTTPRTACARVLRALSVRAMYRTRAGLTVQTFCRRARQPLLRACQPYEQGCLCCMDELETDCEIALAASKMFATLMMTILDDVNTINTWAEPHNANGVTPNTVIDSNDEPPCNNQQRMTIRAY